MTTMQLTEAKPSGRVTEPRPDSTRALRRRVCLATVLTCLPYLGLKLAWVLGLEVGVSAGGFTDTSRVANVLTGGLELLAIGLAVLFVLPAGRRLPAFVMAFPAWVATGLLVPVALGASVGSVVQLAAGGGNAFADDGGLSGWVFGLVYLGFFFEAVLLLAGFVLYARARWPVVTGGGRDVDGAGTTRSLQDLLGGVFAVAAGGFAALQLSWAMHGGGGFADPTTAQRVSLSIAALAALLGGLGALRLLRGARLTRTLLVVVWTGSAVTFAQALMNALKAAAIEAGDWGALHLTPAEGTLTLFILLGALGGAVGGAMRLVEEERDELAHHPTPGPMPGQ